MKMPGNDTSNNGLYEYDENNYYAESLDNSVMEEFNDTAETDFSEYLWMEHEEEFDKEVSKCTFTIFFFLHFFTGGQNSFQIKTFFKSVFIW